MAPQVNALPEWLIVSGSVAGLLAAISQVVFALWRLFRKADLEVKLTKEVFFRITDYGENLFAHAVLIARHGPVEIRKITFKLEKKSPKKIYDLSVLYVGEKVRGSGPFSDNNFYSQSCLSFVPRDLPQRCVYLTVLDKYAIEIRQFLTEFNLATAELKNTYNSASNKGGEVLDDFVRNFLAKFEATIKTAQDSIFDKIQLEDGEFELTIQVEFLRKGILRKEIAVKNSKIGFSLHKNAREIIKADLYKTLETSARNAVLGQNDSVHYPEYIPLDIQELE